VTSTSREGLHLAQFNIGTLLQPLDHPGTAGFVGGLEQINALAERSPGFVWRLKDEHGDATSINVYPNPLTIVNLTVWESPEALREFVYRTDHRDFLRRRGEWFVPGSPWAMWWVPAGTIPTLDDAKARLDFLAEFGATPFASRNVNEQPVLALRRHELDDEVVQTMIQRLNVELKAATPEGGSNFWHIDHEHVAEGNGAFYVAWLDGRPSACGAWRRIDDVAGRPDTAEVKRMWVDPEHRGARLGAAVLATLEAAARHHGITELRLETGEYLTSAVSLYRRFGFEPCAPWGEYVDVAHSHTMSKSLT
jgi:GNAT superfamily N-acetyltransferase